MQNLYDAIQASGKYTIHGTNIYKGDTPVVMGGEELTIDKILDTICELEEAKYTIIKDKNNDIAILQQELDSITGWD